MLQALRDALFAEDQLQPINLVALAGMAGVGKTVLANALTHDPVVRDAFPDGIVWVGLETTAPFVDRMKEVAKALGDKQAGYENTLAAENRYRTVIREKAPLIVLDYLWSKADIDPLLAESPRSRFLFTTQDVSIARQLGARVYHLRPFTEQECNVLLANITRVEIEDLPRVAS